jgi:hypothetical protein
MKMQFEMRPVQYANAPPSSPATFHMNVQLVIALVQPQPSIAPPSVAAEFPMNVQLFMSTVPPSVSCHSQ